MTGIRIGEAYYETVADAMIQCDCGHTVLINQAEEIWADGKVTDICDVCICDACGTHAKGRSACRNR